MPALSTETCFGIRRTDSAENFTVEFGNSVDHRVTGNFVAGTVVLLEIDVAELAPGGVSSRTLSEDDRYDGASCTALLGDTDAGVDASADVSDDVTVDTSEDVASDVSEDSGSVLEDAPQCGLGNLRCDGDPSNLYGSEVTCGSWSGDVPVHATQCEVCTGFEEGCGANADAPCIICDHETFEAALQNEAPFYALGCDLSLEGFDAYLDQEATFFANLDGRNHTLSRVTLSPGQTLFGRLTGSVERLEIDGLQNCQADLGSSQYGLAVDLLGTLSSVTLRHGYLRGSTVAPIGTLLEGPTIRDVRVLSTRIEARNDAAGLFIRGGADVSPTLQRLVFQGAVVHTGDRGSASGIARVPEGVLDTVLVDGVVRSEGRGAVAGVMHGYGECVNCLVRANVSASGPGDVGGFHSAVPIAGRLPRVSRSMFTGHFGNCLSRGGEPIEGCGGGSVGAVVAREEAAWPGAFADNEETVYLNCSALSEVDVMTDDSRSWAAVQDCPLLEFSGASSLWSITPGRQISIPSLETAE